MEEGDMSIARSEAIADEVDAVLRRSASSHVLIICVAGNVACPVNNDNGYRRFKWLRNLVDYICKPCD